MALYLVNQEVQVKQRFTSASPRYNIKLVGVVIEDARESEWLTRVREIQGNDTRLDGQLMLDAIWNWTRNATDFPQNDVIVAYESLSLYSSQENNFPPDFSYNSTICREDAKHVILITVTDVFALDMLLGAEDDGPPNNCSSEDHYIMARDYTKFHQLGTNNPYYFSNCSLQSMDQYIDTLIGTSVWSRSCFLETLPDIDAPNVTDVMPGEVYDPDEQCRLLYGVQSYYCFNDAGLSHRDICKRMPCYGPSQGQCFYSYAAEGTTCGNKKCNTKFAKETQKKTQDHYWPTRISWTGAENTFSRNECIHGDQTGVNCAVVPNLPYYCYYSNVELWCCQSCKDIKGSDEGCQFGDDEYAEPSCQYSSCNTTSDSNFVDNCCNTCRDFRPTTAVTMTTELTTTSSEPTTTIETTSAVSTMTTTSAPAASTIMTTTLAATTLMTTPAATTKTTTTPAATTITTSTPAAATMMTNTQAATTRMTTPAVTTRMTAPTTTATTIATTTSAAARMTTSTAARTTTMTTPADTTVTTKNPASTSIMTTTTTETTTMMTTTTSIATTMTTTPAATTMMTTTPAGTAMTTTPAGTTMMTTTSAATTMTSTPAATTMTTTPAATTTMTTTAHAATTITTSTPSSATITTTQTTTTSMTTPAATTTTTTTTPTATTTMTTQTTASTTIKTTTTQTATNEMTTTAATTTMSTTTQAATTTTTSSPDPEYDRSTIVDDITTSLMTETSSLLPPSATTKDNQEKSFGTSSPSPEKTTLEKTFSNLPSTSDEMKMAIGLGVGLGVVGLIVVGVAVYRLCLVGRANSAAISTPEWTSLSRI
ncbi:mucin-5AC-like [Haliotis rubra]|uniref:mucin-5AC-like n=1 Tax=Haliotis rubra TaxID=36100 RepID=UPI001EE5850E|nr:mucin-5AC-like [Haliotis rubra]